MYKRQVRHDRLIRSVEVTVQLRAIDRQGATILQARGEGSAGKLEKAFEKAFGNLMDAKVSSGISKWRSPAPEVTD